MRTGDESARDELIRCSCDRLDDLILKMLGRYEQVRRWELADEVVQRVALELYRTLEPVTPESSREFLRLASMNIRRQLVDLADHFFGPEGQNIQNTGGRGLDGSNSGDTIAGQLFEGALDPARLAAWTELHRQIDGLGDLDREVFELLWYQGLTQAESEGLAQTPNVVRLGAFPNQHVLPAVEWARDSLGKRRLFLVGSDSIYPRVVGAILAAAAAKLAVEIVGEVYIPASDMLGQVVDLVPRIEATKPDLILSVLYGKANWAFIHQLRTVTRVTAKSLPCISFCLSEQEMRNVLREMVGDYVCGHYFQGLKSAANDRFLERLRGDAKIDRNPFLVSDAMEASYVGGIVRHPLFLLDEQLAPRIHFPSVETDFDWGPRTKDYTFETVTHS